MRCRPLLDNADTRNLNDPDLGAVAQMGERCNRTAEVRGSIPLGSTNWCKCTNCRPKNRNLGKFRCVLQHATLRAALLDFVLMATLSTHWATTNH